MSEHDSIEATESSHEAEQELWLWATLLALIFPIIGAIPPMSGELGRIRFPFVLSASIDVAAGIAPTEARLP